MAAQITYKDVEERLLSVEEVLDTLAEKEPLDSEFISIENDIKFKFNVGWDEEINFGAMSSPSGVEMDIDGSSRSLTREALFSATSNAGLPAALVKKMPGDLLKTNLEYFYGDGMADKEYNALIVDGQVSAFTRPSITPYSNLALVESVFKGIRARYGKDTLVMADYKISNTLTKTDVRFIIPGESWVINDTDMPDVPSGSADIWNVGVHVSNSLIGKTQTKIEAYLFRWWCTNGAVTVPFSESTAWRRGTDGDDGVYEWAEFQTEDVLSHMKEEFARIQAMTKDVVEEPDAFLRSLFDSAHLPANLRQQVIRYLEDFEGPLTLYVVMQAITRLANNVSMSSDNIDRLLHMGGAVPTHAYDPSLAKVWANGHHAPTGAKNPFELASA